MRTEYHLLNVTVFLTGVFTLAYSDSGLAIVQANGSANKPVVSFDLSRIDEEVIREFKKAWALSGNGNWKVEGVVLIFPNPDGSYNARSMGMTNQNRAFTFKWDPKAIAIVHTHPCDRDPKPNEPDRKLSDKLGVPIFTITSRGMFMYDPATRKTIKVMDGLKWLDISKWNQRRWPC